MSIVSNNNSGNNSFDGTIPNLLGEESSESNDETPSDPKICSLFQKLNLEWLVRAIPKNIYPLYALQTLSLRKFIYLLTILFV